MNIILELLVSLTMNIIWIPSIAMKYKWLIYYCHIILTSLVVAICISLDYNIAVFKVQWIVLNQVIFMNYHRVLSA